MFDEDGEYYRELAVIEREGNVLEGHRRATRATVNAARAERREVELRTRRQLDDITGLLDRSLTSSSLDSSVDERNPDGTWRRARPEREDGRLAAVQEPEALGAEAEDADAGDADTVGTDDFQSMDDTEVGEAAAEVDPELVQEALDAQAVQDEQNAQDVQDSPDTQEPDDGEPPRQPVLQNVENLINQRNAVLPRGGAMNPQGQPGPAQQNQPRWGLNANPYPQPDWPEPGEDINPNTAQGRYLRHRLEEMENRVAQDFRAREGRNREETVRWRDRAGQAERDVQQLRAQLEQLQQQLPVRNTPPNQGNRLPTPPPVAAPQGVPTPNNTPQRPLNLAQRNLTPRQPVPRLSPPPYQQAVAGMQWQNWAPPLNQPPPRLPAPQLQQQWGQPPPLLMQPQPPVVQPQQRPFLNLQMLAPQRQPTPARGRDGTPRGTPGNRMGQRQDGREYLDLRSLKLDTFKGKDVESFCDLFERVAEQCGWGEQQKRLHLLSRLDSWIRNMFLDAGEDVTAEDMMHNLKLRFGVNLSLPDVYNRLRKLERKPNEDLADRVQTLVRRADIPLDKRKQLARDTFFAALVDESDLQHWVGARDVGREPDIYHTLSLATYWERMHDVTKRRRSDRAHQVSDQTDSTPAPQTPEDEDELVNRLNSMRVRDMQSDDARKLARGYNDLAGLLKKQAELVLDDRDTRSDRYRNSRDSRDSRSGSSRSSSNRSWKPRRESGDTRSDRRSRSRRRDGAKGGKPDWKSKTRDKKFEKKWDRKDKKKRTEVKQVEDEDRSPSPARPSDDSDPESSPDCSSDE